MDRETKGKKTDAEGGVATMPGNKRGWLTACFIEVKLRKLQWTYSRDCAGCRYTYLYPGVVPLGANHMNQVEETTLALVANVGSCPRLGLAYASIYPASKQAGRPVGWERGQRGTAWQQLQRSLEGERQVELSSK